MKETRTRFDLRRKVVAAMTAEGWREAPHACMSCEEEATALLETLEEINAGLPRAERITLNTALLKLTALALAACPGLNGRIRYRRGLVRGETILSESVDASVPMLLGGRMVSVTLRGLESKTLSQIRDDIADVRRRAENTHLSQALYEVSRRDTLRELGRLHILRGVGRFLGFWLDHGGAALPHGRAKREYAALPETERLTWRDLEQGSVTVSNIGSLYPDGRAVCSMLEIVPPQLCAICYSSVRESPIADGGAVRVGKVLPVLLAFDHRALDAGDVVPFFQKLDELFAHPEELKRYMSEK